jgi:alginate O-acetyltransferase complex protein AlgI
LHRIDSNPIVAEKIAMPFNSPLYFLFLALLYPVFYLVADRWRWCVLLTASLIFYAALKVPYLLGVLALVTLASYLLGILIDGADRPKLKGVLLCCGIAVNLLVLVVMKYLPFLWENLASLLHLVALPSQVQPVGILVSIGVSYYIFQALSYLIDIYF